MPRRQLPPPAVLLDRIEKKASKRFEKLTIRDMDAIIVNIKRLRVALNLPTTDIELPKGD